MLQTRAMFGRRLSLLVLTYLLLSTCVAHAATVNADTLYREAQRCYYGILNDTDRQGRRDQWTPCITAFAKVAKLYPDSPRTPAALFSAAKTYELMFNKSKSRDDLQAAADRYEALAQHYADDRLADDALYRAAVIHWEGFAHKGRTNRTLSKIIRRYPEGDRFKPAQQFAKRLKNVRRGKFVSLASLARIEPTPLPASLAAITPAPKKTSDQLYIVIDPGHGGKDPGARGPGGTLEKTVTLQIAKRLKKDLETRLGASVRLTRGTDRTLSLEKRNRFANGKAADLFISIHANAHTSSAQRGVQTYYLNNASDDAARKLAARENKHAGAAVRSELDHIMSTMMQNAFTDESRRLAQSVHKHMVGRLQKNYASVQDQKVRSALFYVLVGAKSPAILVETSYLSHPEEEKRLRSTKYQQHIARGITNGVIEFFENGKTRIAL